MKYSDRLPLGRRLFAILLAPAGLLLLLGGAWLLALGGSSWYVITGAASCLCAVLVWRGIRWGAWLYGAMLAYTLAWSLWEVGLDAWALVPRLGAPAVLGLLLLTPRLRRVCIGLAAMAVIGLAVEVALPGTRAETGVARAAPQVAADAAAGDWRSYGNDSKGTRYSDLAQITPRNVGRIELAWSFRSGDLAQPGQNYNFEVTPLKIGRVLYFCTPSSQAFALDAASGKLIWRFDAKSDLRGVTAFACRGVSYYSTALASGPCAERIFVGTPDAKLWGLDALTGKPCPDFGPGGAIDLLSGLGEVVKGMYTVSSPPLVTHGKLVVGANVRDNVSTDMPSGVVRAFDAVSGALAWAWDVGHLDRTAAPKDGETYTRSTPNSWAPMVADDALGMVYLPTGNPAADFWGGWRRPFDERYGSSLVALDVNTGELRWSFQTTHHDLWDKDLSSQPVLVDVPTAEGSRPAVIAGTKEGDLFILDRRTGAPIVPVTERPVPGMSNIGEKPAPTQPASVLAVNPGPAWLSESAMWGATPLDQMWCRIQYRRARYLGPYTPPGTGRASIVYPGMFGGVEWGGLAVDPVRQILIANPSAMPFLVKMERVGSSPQDVPKGLQEIKGTGYAVSYFAFLSPLRMPCMQPPWGKLYAIDLRTDRVIWERPVGTIADLGPLGMATHLPLLIGTPQVGGTVVTRGGLIFSAATLDRYFRAYDLGSGKELWKARLPAGGQASPITYEAEGRQFVVLAAGGHAVLDTKRGDYLLAYALPRTDKP